MIDEKNYLHYNLHEIEKKIEVKRNEEKVFGNVNGVLYGSSI